MVELLWASMPGKAPRIKLSRAAFRNMIVDVHDSGLRLIETTASDEWYSEERALFILHVF